MKTIGLGISRFNLTWRITLAVGAALLAGVAATAMLLTELRSINAEYTAMLTDKQVQHQDKARVIQLTFKTQVQEWKNLLLRGSDFENFQKYEKAFQEEEKATAAAATTLLAELSDEQARGLLQRFVSAHARMGQSYASAIATFGQSKGRDFAGADAIVKGQDREPIEQIDALAVRLQEVAGEAQKAEAAVVDATIRRSTIVVSVVFVLVVVMAVIIVRFTRRELVDLTQELTQAAHSAGSGASQVATSAQALSQGATEQASSVEETSASMEEMSSMTRKNAENSQSAAGLMAGVDTRVQDSNRALGDMVSAMTGIRDSSQQVARIIKTIDEIAFQTNILALNAAVEAARAGEAGMGFAVVADEVRNLAQRSAQAARDTAALIEESIAKTQEGSQRVEHVAQSIGGITESVTTVKGLVEEVSVASSQQSQGIDQVSQAIAQIEKVTQQTAATAEESAAASEELSAQAEAAMAAVRKLERIVGVTSLPAAAATRRSHVVERRADVLPMRETRAARPQPPATAEDLLPLGDTGTYGRF